MRTCLVRICLVQSISFSQFALNQPAPAAQTRAVLPFPNQTALRWAALGPKAAPAMIVNQQPMIALPMLMVTEASGSPMSWSSSTIGACVRKHNILWSAETSTAAPFAYDIRMKIVSFVLGAVVLAPLGWVIGGLVGETVVASILGGLFGLLMAWVLRRPLSWLFDLLSFLP